MGRFYIGGGVAHEQAILGRSSQTSERFEDDVGVWLCRETIRALYVIEIGQ
jgi:hypothetical protein